MASSDGWVYAWHGDGSNVLTPDPTVSGRRAPSRPGREDGSPIGSVGRSARHRAARHGAKRGIAEAADDLGRRDESARSDDVGVFEEELECLGEVRERVLSRADVRHACQPRLMIQSRCDPDGGSDQRLVGFTTRTEPQTYALMLAGLGVVGIAARRIRRR